MRLDTRQRKKARRGLEEIIGRKGLDDCLGAVLLKGNQGLDALMWDLGRMLAETIMYVEREEISEAGGKVAPVLLSRKIINNARLSYN